MKHTLIRNDRDHDHSYSGCSVAPKRAARRAASAPPVFVNGVEISESAIALETHMHAAGTPAEARAAAARALVIRTLLLQRAAALGFDPEPQTDARGRLETEEEALVRQVLDHEVSGAEPTQEECRRLHAARAPTSSFEEAAPHLREKLRARAWMTAAARYVARLAQTAEIEGIELVLGRAEP